MQIKTTRMYHLTLVRMDIIKKSTTNKCWRGWRGKGKLLHCWWEFKLVQPLWRTVLKFLKKLKIELPYYTAIPFLDIYPEKTMIQKDTYTPMFTVALFIIAMTWKQPKYPSTEEWIKMMWHMYSGILLSHKKTWTDLETQTEWNNSERQKHILYINAYIWNLEKCID